MGNIIFVLVLVFLAVTLLALVSIVLLVTVDEDGKNIFQRKIDKGANIL